MKIIKIELQNLNSLKSDTPIVIDFESEAFRNIGLYAITGPTGAGKTTILDAITIALYHEVPRFNKSHIKSGLEDVVSYGASEALSRITFDSKAERFEAQWSMRLTSKTGKILGKPIETVRLKNLTTGKIIAEKKRELQNEIEKITHLTYQQFLRSLMLAQGEFAAFLSANGKDKGTLLEQITGEEIYKKIGEAIIGKIFQERKILDAIKAKINNEDILSGDERQELRQEQKELAEKTNHLHIEIKQLERIIAWYQKAKDLQQTKLQLENANIQIEKDKLENQDFLAALSLHEQAEPFKANIDEITRIEKEIQTNRLRYGQINTALTKLVTEIEQAEKQEVDSKDIHAQKENDLKLWLPKFDTISQLDADIFSTRQTKDKTTFSLVKLKESIQLLQNNVALKQRESKRKEEQLKAINYFLDQHSNTPIIEKQFVNWSSKLSLRKNNLDRFFVDEKNLKKDENELINIKALLTNKQEFFATDSEQLKKLNNELLPIETFLQSNSLDAFLPQQKELEQQQNNWKELQNISKDFVQFTQKQKELGIEKQRFITKKIELKEKIEKLIVDIFTAEQSLKDSEKTLELERTIVSLEAERTHLEKGMACKLCGSTEHPLVEKYGQIEISKTKEELEKRKDLLGMLKGNEKTFSISLAEVETKMNTNLSQEDETTKTIITIEKKYSEPQIDCAIDDQEKISYSILQLEKQIAQLSEKISRTQQYQKQKDNKDKQIINQNESVNLLKNEITRLQEKYANLSSELQQKQGALARLNSETGIMEAEINKELSVFDLAIPTAEKTSEFIQQIETKIAAFHAKKTELIEVNNLLAQLLSDIKNSEKRIIEKITEADKYQKEISELSTILLGYQEKRKAILPLEISKEKKREELQDSIQNAKQELEKTSKYFQNLKTKKSTTEKEKDLIAKNELDKKTELAISFKSLQASLSSSIFQRKEEIEKALLNQELKSKYSEIRKQLENKTLELKTLNTKLNNDLAKLENEKDFETPEDETKIKYAEIDSIREQLLKRSGEITKQFDLDNQIKERNKDVFAEIEKQEKILRKWNELNNLLGGSKHAFNTYVQRLTLQNLIHLANIHLFKLNKRYSLKMNETYKPGEELNFVLVDHYQTGKARPIDTSSGGEKFLISLALALGLSDLASNNVNIGSLFIDEGFGTLDNNTLETVISTLETLQAQGKMIGIISHVENLKERISTQIQVSKKSNGVSVVEVLS